MKRIYIAHFGIIYIQICMNWQSVKFDWNRVRAFVATAEEGSLSAAARALGMKQPTLSRQVAALEEELGVVLFERIGKTLAITQSGLELLEHARGMGRAATHLSLSASGQSAEMEGDVCITASELIAAFIMPSIIAKLRVRHPQIRIELIASNTPSDLRRREADIAVRTFQPTQPDLIALKVCDLPTRFYASPMYLDTVADLSAISDLAHVDFIDFDASGNYATFLIGQGIEVSQDNFPIVAENHIVQMELARAGLGVVVLPEIIGCAERDLTQVLPMLAPMDSPIWLVAHREVSTSRRIRAVFDLLKAELVSL